MTINQVSASFFPNFAPKSQCEKEEGAGENLAIDDIDVNKLNNNNLIYLQEVIIPNAKISD